MEKWKEDLRNSLVKELEEQRRKQEDDKRKRDKIESEIEEFSTSKIGPTFEELRTELELEEEGYKLNVRVDKPNIHEQSIVVQNPYSNKEFRYTIHAEIEKTPEGEISPDGIRIYSVTTFGDIEGMRPQEKRGQPFNISKVTKEEIAQDFVDNLKQYVKDFVK